jgi:rubrerythrin
MTIPYNREGTTSMTILTCEWCGFTEQQTETCDNTEPCPCCGLLVDEVEN